MKKEKCGQENNYSITRKNNKPDYSMQNFLLCAHISEYSNLQVTLQELFKVADCTKNSTLSDGVTAELQVAFPWFLAALLYIDCMTQVLKIHTQKKKNTFF